MAKQRVRLKEIAEATGYSINTVSLALRGSPRLPEETRTKIYKEAERQNYLPNHVARTLKRQATHTIGLIIADILDPAVALLARSIDRQLALVGYGMMIVASDFSAENEVKALSRFQTYRVDGVLVIPANRNNTTHFTAVQNAGRPVIALTDVHKNLLNSVAVNNWMGAYKAIMHLIDKGHTNITILDKTNAQDHSDKIDGAMAGMRDADLPTENITLISTLGDSIAYGYQAIQEALVRTPKPTAIFATTDALAIGALNWCLNNGISIPDDLAIIGCGNTEAAKYSAVPLTTIKYDPDKISSYAVARLIEMIEHPGNSTEKIKTLIEPDLMVRAST